MLSCLYTNIHSKHSSWEPAGAQTLLSWRFHCLSENQSHQSHYQQSHQVTLEWNMEYCFMLCPISGLFRDFCYVNFTKEYGVKSINSHNWIFPGFGLLVGQKQTDKTMGINSSFIINQNNLLPISWIRSQSKAGRAEIDGKQAGQGAWWPGLGSTIVRKRDRGTKTEGIWWVDGKCQKTEAEGPI